MKPLSITYVLHLVFCCSLILIAMGCSSDQNQIFKLVDPSVSGLDFQNKLVDSDSLNIIDYLYYYNGGGVAIGDLNNDSLPDIVFTANQSSDRIYMNQGGLKFQDVTENSGIDQSSGWSTGVQIVDVNADGWNDIYVCRVGDYLHLQDHNRLYINQQNGSFIEQSAAYGLDFSGFSTQAAFFDFDQDGDLDCYLLNHSVKNPEQFAASNIRRTIDEQAGDRFYVNEDGHYIDRSAEMGIYQSSVGFGLGIATADLNNDGWVDLYIGNDFHEQDYVYLNNTGKGFIEVSEQVLGHSSNFTMGVSMEDLDENGFVDIVTLDMQADREAVYKASGGWENMQIYNFKHSYGYHYQSPRNTLQFNLGESPRKLDTSGIKNHPSLISFTEQAASYSFHATDWSWSPLIADFDGDLLKDIYVTNGIYKRPNNMDYVDYMTEQISIDKSDQELIEKMPSGVIENRLFLKSIDGYEEQKIPELPSVSNGASYADLDRDGDYDIVVNNINQDAFLLENKSDPSAYSLIHFQPLNNTTSANAMLIEFKSGERQHLNLQCNLGFQSARNDVPVIPRSSQDIKEIQVMWADGSTEVFDSFEARSNIILIQGKGQITTKLSVGSRQNSIVYDTVAIHQENSYEDQNTESLIPYKLSTNGPRIVVGEKSYIVCPSKGQVLSICMIGELAQCDTIQARVLADVADAAIVDINGDGLEDIYIGLGGNESVAGGIDLVDYILIQKQDGSYERLEEFPNVTRNTGAIVASDFDLDGDVDFFVGVQGKAGMYGLSENSYFLFNRGSGRFSKSDTDISELVFDVEVADLDGNGLPDIVVAGQWMPITILYQQDPGKFRKEVLKESTGLWFDIELSDIDQDGKIDILAGNFGMNHRLVEVGDLSLLVGDFDDNGQVDPIINYVADSKRQVYGNLTMMSKQLPMIRKRFDSHESFANADLAEILTKKGIAQASNKSINTLKTCSFIQSGSGWLREDLPAIAQVAPIWAIQPLGNSKYLMGGNFYGIDPNLGRQDAGRPLVVEYSEDSWKILHLFKEFDSELRDIEIINSDCFMSYNNGPCIRIDVDVLHHYFE